MEFKSDEVKLLFESKGWQILLEEVKEEVLRLEQIIYTSSNRDEVYGCAKQLAGIKFVTDDIPELLAEREE